MDVETTSWREAVQRYQAHAELRKSKGTWVKAAPILERFGVLLGVEQLLGAITLEQLEAYQRERASQLEPATVNSHLRTLSAFLGWCVRRRLLADNPCRFVERLPVADREPSVIDEADVVRLFDHLVDGKRTLVYAQLLLWVVNTGLRLGEALWMHVEDVRGDWVIVRSRPEYPLKRRRERRVRLNAMSRRIYELRQFAAAKLPGALLWRSSRGTRIDKRNALAVIQRAADKLGIPDVTWQALRRTFSTAIAPCVSELAYAAILGHSIAVARKWYICAMAMHQPEPPVIGHA